MRPPSLAADVAAFTATAGPYYDAEEAARARWAGTEDTAGTTAAPTVSSGTHDADGTTATRAAGTTAAPTVSSSPIEPLVPPLPEEPPAPPLP